MTSTLFYGRRLLPNTQFFIDPEISGGAGFNKTQGIAGFPNAEIYRVDDPSAKWNLARMYLQQTFDLSAERIAIKDDKNQIGGTEARDRITLVIGKFSLNDFFDSNTYAHDPRTQFLNWGFMDNLAWDYAADTRGYTWGIYAELIKGAWSIRASTALVPKEANQITLETNFPKFRGDNIEIDYRYTLYSRPATARLLLYHNHAMMGNYRTTVDSTLSAPGSAIDITQSRGPSDKTGVGLNVEQTLTPDIGLFARLGWSDGHNETWAFTEVDRTFSVGAVSAGMHWRRPEDRVGIAWMINGLSDDHRDYLASGGVGFIVGDGTGVSGPGKSLQYAPEQITELYYLLKAMPGLDGTLDYQYVMNPAYNEDRGPVSIYSLRVHYEI